MQLDYHLLQGRQQFDAEDLLDTKFSQYLQRCSTQSKKFIFRLSGYGANEKIPRSRSILPRGIRNVKSFVCVTSRLPLCSYDHHRNHPFLLYHKRHLHLRFDHQISLQLLRPIIPLHDYGIVHLSSSWTNHLF